jgi:hypothetical protein
MRTLPPVDLDHSSTWPRGLVDELNAAIRELVEEMRTYTEFILADDHLGREAPARPTTEWAIQRIMDRMRDRRLRVFHATRLLDPDEVITNGLRPLSLDERISRLAHLTKVGPLTEVRSEFEAALRNVDLSNEFFTIREGSVWFTPMRRYLYDGGCDVFFDHWGGEAIQRFAAMGSPKLEAAIRSIGNPAVVVAHIPAYGSCKLGATRLAPTMLELALETVVPGWDVLVKEAVPPSWIEQVLPPTDPYVAG